MEKSSAPPPPASAFLREFTHADEDAKGGRTPNTPTSSAMEAVSNFIGVSRGAGTPSSAGSAGGEASMKHRKEHQQPYDKRMPKMNYDADDDNHSTHSANSKASLNSSRSNASRSGSQPLIPSLISRNQSSSSGASSSTSERILNKVGASPTPMAKSTTIRSTSFTYAAPSSASEAIVPPRRALGARLLNFFNPRVTDVQQMITKLERQFQNLQYNIDQYEQNRNGCMYQEESGNEDQNNQITSERMQEILNDSKHPLNNPSLIHEVHFVGRGAMDPFATLLCTTLTNLDSYGTITELWLNNNLISDDGASAIASLLQLPSCALVELWLGNNKIGPVGTALLSAALSSNEKSQLRCLGLYGNPIENGGAGCLAQMLRRNHVLSTVDVHGCLWQEGKANGSGDGEDEVETYGCRVVSTDARYHTIGGTADEKAGFVTDQRLMDAIKTFAAFNRINPTREQAIRGLMSATAGRSSKNGMKNPSDEKEQKSVSKFLSELCILPGNERLTDDEKKKWKNCEWARLEAEMELERAAKLAEEQLDAHLDVGHADGNSEKGVTEGEHLKVGRDLDGEVVVTEAKKWRDLKMGIAGSAKVLPQQHGKNSERAGTSDVPLSNERNEKDEKGEYEQSAADFDEPPPNPFTSGTSPKPNSKRVPPVPQSHDTSTENTPSENTLRLMQMCDDLERAEKEQAVAKTYKKSETELVRSEKKKSGLKKEKSTREVTDSIKEDYKNFLKELG